MWEVFKNWIFDIIQFFFGFCQDWGLAIIIVTIIATAATIGLSIRQAATTARNTGLENTTVTAQISLDREKLISESRNQSNSSESDTSD